LACECAQVSIYADGSKIFSYLQPGLTVLSGAVSGRPDTVAAPRRMLAFLSGALCRSVETINRDPG
jgi:hypothetical protein